jgi:hypothetical protein
MRRLPPNTIEILFELRRVNERTVRVVAIDPITRTEVVMVGDYKQGEAALKKLAARKLQYVLKKKLTEAEAARKKQ